MLLAVMLDSFVEVCAGDDDEDEEVIYDLLKYIGRRRNNCGF